MPRRDGVSRRWTLVAGLGALVLPAALGAAPEAPLLKLRLEETAGLRRFGFPVHTVLPSPTPGTGRSFRLTRDGRDVPAQFRPIAGPGGKAAVALDFNASPGPFEVQEYAIVDGGPVGPSPKARGGLRVEHVDHAFRVSNGSHSGASVRDDLLGFLGGFRNGMVEFVHETSEGLVLRDKDGIDHRVGGKGPEGIPTRGSIARQGPIAVGFRFEGTEAPRAGRTSASTLDMGFSDSKTWVEATWRVEDPEGRVAALGLDLRLRVDEGPTLVDLGAGSTVYGQLRGRERMELEAGSAPGLPGTGRRWVVRKGPPDACLPFAESPRGDATPPAEGWVHVMDRSRCTALAVGGFGRASRDRIEVEADGRVRLRREFAGGGASPPPGPKTVTFWLHFVSMPVQVGAATSPQAMLAPLAVTWVGDVR